MQLPEYDNLDIAKLSTVFRVTTNSYKFYWFLSILDSLRDNGERFISQKDIALRMLANVWYPLDYFKLSFGSQDGFKKVAKFVSSKMTVDNRPNSSSLFEQIKKNFTETDLTELTQETKKLYRWVPFRFVRPFIELETKGILDQNVNAAIIRICGELFENQSHRIMYRFVGDSIELNSVWVEYLQKHQGILRGFIFWHLVKFVQKNNPNVIGLSEKLQKPTARDLKLANRFWKGYLAENSDVTCIYSQQTITEENLSLDHFLPWSYVVHDQLWNIIPTPKNINSGKSDGLPSFEMYFESFLKIQYDAVQFYLKKGNIRILEDYNRIFHESLNEMSLETFRDVLTKQIVPQLQTAQNLGFSYPNVFDKVTKKWKMK
ncbi:HNH endonuclease domain-containing protein [Runella sp.]|uniref:HNH endonuclease domain-containing protein n=1 Tax=Runella sp. TaxID=1960881 RepID=UPI003D12C301